MTVKLKAFGKLTAYHEVQSLREKVYLIHRKLTPISLSGEMVVSDLPTHLKAVFEYQGRGEDEMPVYEFIGLE